MGSSILCVVLATLIWGSSFVVISVSVQQVSPFLFLALRFGIASIAIGLRCLGHLRQLTGRRLRQGLLLGVLLAGNTVLLTYGLQTVDPSTASFIDCLSIIVVPLLARLLDGEPFNRLLMLSCLLALAGLYVITLMNGVQFSRHLLYIVGSMLFFAYYLRQGSTLPADAPLTAVLWVQFITVFIIAIGLS